jgi:hypothetical protein
MTTQAAETSGDGGISFGMGMLGVLLTVGLIASVVLLYRSMRTQLKRIDFDPEGTTDAERMRGRGADRPGEDDGANGYHKPSTS